MSKICGNVVGVVDPLKTLILVDDSGNEVVTGVVVDQETVFTATDNDVREGCVYASEVGVSTGTKDIPAYHTSEGKRVITAGSAFTIPVNNYEYTSLLCVICKLNTSLTNSVSAEKIVTENSVYPVQSTVAEAQVTFDADNKCIVLGITNDTTTSYILRYFTYKEIV